MADLNPDLPREIQRLVAEDIHRRLSAPPCEHCKRSFVTHQELTAFMRWLEANELTDALRSARAPLRRLDEALPVFDDQRKIEG